MPRFENEQEDQRLLCRTFGCVGDRHAVTCPLYDNAREARLIADELREKLAGEQILPKLEEESASKGWDAQAAEIERRFTYHAPKKGSSQPARYVMLRDTAKDYAELIMANCPKSRERSIALTRLEETVMWANAAIARRE